MNDKITLTKGEQFIYDWQYRHLDDTSFKGLLAKLMAKADSGNLQAYGKGSLKKLMLWITSITRKVTGL